MFGPKRDVVVILLKLLLLCISEGPGSNFGSETVMTEVLSDNFRPTRKILLVRFEVITAVKIKFVVFSVSAPCSMVVVYQRFGGTYCFHLQG